MCKNMHVTWTGLLLGQELVSGHWLCLWELWHSIINTTQHVSQRKHDTFTEVVVLVMECYNSQKHSQSPLTKQEYKIQNIGKGDCTSGEQNAEYNKRCCLWDGFVLVRWDFIIFLQMKRDFCAMRVCGRELNEFNVMKWSRVDLSRELEILYRFRVAVEVLTVVGLNILDWNWGHKLRWILKAKMQLEWTACGREGNT